MIMPCMKSASALDGALGASPALAAAGERALLEAPGAPGWTSAGGGADCCANAVRLPSVRAETAKMGQSLRDNKRFSDMRLYIWGHADGLRAGVGRTRKVKLQQRGAVLRSYKVVWMNILPRGREWQWISDKESSGSGR